MKTLKKMNAEYEDEARLPVENNEPGETGYNYGDDEIEIEKGDGEKIVYGSTFSYKDGDMGDESEDIDDLPSVLKSTHNMYNPRLSTGDQDEAETMEGDEIKRGIHIVKQEDAGLSYGKDN
jgi:hypothetical protein